MGAEAMSIPIFATRREVCLMGETWTDVLAIRPKDIEALWLKARDEFGFETLRSIHVNTDKSLAWEVYRTDDGLLTLWLGEQRLARLQR